MKIKDIMDPSPNLIRTSDTFEHLIKILDEVKYHVVFVVDKDDKEDTVIKAAALMVVNKIHTLPVIRGCKVVGIIPRLTLIRHITKVLSEY